MRNLILPTALMVGTVIGAGIFALPFVFQKSGLLIGLFYLIALGLVSYLINLMYADIIVRTNQPHHRFPGYAGVYLGPWAEKFSTAIVLLATLLTLTAYLIVSLSFFNLITGQIPAFYKLLIFWAIGSLTIFLKIGRAAFMEVFTTALTLIIILAIFLGGIFSGFFENLPALVFAGGGNAFLPFGPVLFSILGLTAVQPLVVYFKEKNLPLAGIKKALIWGAAIPALFYFLFSVGIIGLSGQASADSVSGLIGRVPPIFLTLLGIFGVVSLIDSYATVAFDIKKNIRYEWKFSKPLAALAVIILPPLFYLLGVSDFLQSISVIGGVLFSAWCILTILVWHKARKRNGENTLVKNLNNSVVYAVLAIFIVALILEIFTGIL